MRRLSKFRRTAITVLIAILVGSAGWLYWNRVPTSNLTAWAPADSLAYVEVNDLSSLVQGIQQGDAWKVLGPLLDAPDNLAPNRWVVRLARWTGIGSADAVLFARSQVAIVFSGAEGTQTGSTLIIKPLLTLILETHTSQNRMRAAVEHLIEKTARDDFGNAVFVRKNMGGIELEEWQSEDGTRRLVTAFVNTTVIIANDEPSVLHAVEAATGGRPSLKTQSEVEQARQATNSAGAALFGFVTQAGVKSLLQAYALKAEGSDGASSDSITKARLLADTFGGIVTHLGWTARFASGSVEDHFSIALAEGINERLRNSMSPDRTPDLSQISFTPSDAHSVSIYSFHDTATVWGDLSAVISSHTDLIGAMATRPIMRSLLNAYGVVDTEVFTRGVGPRLQTVRTEEGYPALLIADVFDRPIIEKAIAGRFGINPKRERFADADLMISTDNWTAAFYQNSFLIGPGEQVRRCLQARADGDSISSTHPFRQAQRFVDITVPLTVLTFTNDSGNAVSFVETFSRQPRSAFSTNAAAIAEVSKTLPLAMSAVVVRKGSLEWTSRSSFGIGGAIVTELFPGK
jgi:sarcosine oxidase delta subunit